MNISGGPEELATFIRSCNRPAIDVPKVARAMRMGVDAYAKERERQVATRAATPENLSAAWLALGVILAAALAFAAANA